MYSVQNIMTVGGNSAILGLRTNVRDTDGSVLGIVTDRYIALASTPEALKVLKIIWNMQSDHEADSLIGRTRTGKGKTATNLEYRMVTIFRNAGLRDRSGGLHIFWRAFATRLYEKGRPTKEIAAYIGDLESTAEKYYIAVRKKRVVE